MKKMSVIVAGASALALLSATAAFGQSQEDINRIERRLDTIDAKLDALIDMVGAQGPSKVRNKEAAPVASDQAADANQTAASDDTAAEVAAPAGLQNGIQLELYAVSRESQIPDGPRSGYSASEVVAPSEVFEWGLFTTVPSMQRYQMRSEDKRIGLAWTGLVNIADAGSTVFNLDIVTDDSAGTKECISVLKIDDGEVVRASLYSYPRFTSESGSVALAAGLHKFWLWTLCFGSDPDFGKVHFIVKLKGPKDRNPKPISPDRFFVEG